MQFSNIQLNKKNGANSLKFGQDHLRIAFFNILNTPRDLANFLQKKH